MGNAKKFAAFYAIFAFWSMTGTLASADPDPLALPSKKELGTIELRDPTNDDVKGIVHISQEDVLWIARMINDEGAGNDPEHAAITVWALLQHARCSSTSRFSVLGLIRNFSSALNPRFTCAYKGTDAQCADYCEDGKPNAAAFDVDKTGKGKSACAASLLVDTGDRSRILKQKRPWSGLSRIARETAIKFGRGELPNPSPGVIDWDENCMAAKMTHVRRVAANYADNKGRWDGDCASARKAKINSVNTFYYGVCQNEWSDKWTGHEIRLVSHDGKVSDIGPEVEAAAKRATEGLPSVERSTTAPAPACPVSEP
jgi:hypothetical protein